MTFAATTLYFVIQRNKQMDDFQEITAVAGALADESRLRAFVSLCEGERCVCQIVELLGLSWSTVSRHLSILREAGLVELKKTGRWAYYHVPQNPTPLVRRLMQGVPEILRSSQRAQADQRRMKAITKIDPEDLCRRQNQSKCCSPTSAACDIETARKSRGRLARPVCLSGKTKVRQ